MFCSQNSSNFEKHTIGPKITGFKLVLGLKSKNEILHLVNFAEQNINNFKTKKGRGTIHNNNL